MDGWVGECALNYIECVCNVWCIIMSSCQKDRVVFWCLCGVLGWYSYTLTCTTLVCYAVHMFFHVIIYLKAGIIGGD